MDRVEDLRADYDRLGRILAGEDDGSKAAALVRERRIVGAELERLEQPKVVPFVDELAAKRTASGAGRPPSRRKSG